MTLWVSLPERYQLADVQASLNVAIAILSTSGIFVFVRYCWHTAARKVAKKQNVPVYSLVSLNTVGEVWDIIWLLKKDLFASRYLGLLAQCLVVVALTAMTILSGFVARLSTRTGYITDTKDVNGTIAVREISVSILADADWNLTLSNLNRANFPTDQLLEYLPDQNSNWTYNPTQWNSSWSMDCDYTDKTDLPPLENVGNCSDLYYEIPGLTNVLNPADWDDNNWDSSFWQINSTLIKDMMLFVHGVSWGKLNTTSRSYRNITIMTGVVYLKSVPFNTTLPDNCNFRKGPIGPAFYTAMKCRLNRNPSMGNDETEYGAYPDYSKLSRVVTAYTAHFVNRFYQEAARNRTITVITGPELVRFYQAYSIIRDTILGQFVTRSMDVSVEVTQVALACIILGSICGALILFGMAIYMGFIGRNFESFVKTPESKLDWVLKTIQADGVNRASARLRLRSSMASGIDDDSVPLQPTVPDRKVDVTPSREDFEGATWLPYRTPSVRTTTSYTSLQAPSTSPYMYTDTTYNSLQRQPSQVQPIEDGYFHSRWT